MNGIVGLESVVGRGRIFVNRARQKIILVKK